MLLRCARKNSIRNGRSDCERVPSRIHKHNIDIKAAAFCLHTFDPERAQISSHNGHYVRESTLTRFKWNNRLRTTACCVLCIVFGLLLIYSLGNISRQSSPVHVVPPTKSVRLHSAWDLCVCVSTGCSIASTLVQPHTFTLFK